MNQEKEPIQDWKEVAKVTQIEELQSIALLKEKTQICSSVSHPSNQEDKRKQLKAINSNEVN